jgi:tetratricopeptide (TPR) repeat protein
LHELAVLLSDRGKFQEAGALYEETLNLNDRLFGQDFASGSGVDGGLVYVLRRQGRTADIRALCGRRLVKQAAAPVKPDRASQEKRAQALNHTAWMFLGLGDPAAVDAAACVRAAERAVELMPDAGACWNTLGVARYRAGEWKAAIDALTKSMELSSSFAHSEMVRDRPGGWISPRLATPNERTESKNAGRCLLSRLG